MRRTHLGILIVFMLVFGLVLPVYATEKIVVLIENNPQLLQFHKEMAEEFSELWDVEVEIMTASGDYREQVGVLLASGVQLDITQLWAEAAAPYFEWDAFVDLNTFIEDDPDVQIENFAPARIEAFTWHGKLFGLPMNANAFLGYYNRDALKYAGLEPPEALGDKWNWAALKEYARLLSADTDGDGIIDRPALRMSLLPLERSLERSIPAFAEQAGGRIFDRYVDPTMATFSDAKSLQGLEFLVSLYVEGVASNAGNFYSGNNPMLLFEGPFVMAYLADANVSFDWGVMDLPMGPVHNGTIMLGIGYQIPASSKNQALAWEFIKYLANNVNSVNRMVEITGRTPAFIPALPDYQGLLLDRFRDRTVLNFASKIMSVHTFPGPVVRNLDEINSIIGRLMSQAANGEIPVEIAALEIDRRVNAILQEMSKD